MKPKIATGFERLAIDLEQHIKQYTPGGWVVPISNVAFVPMISREEAEVYMQAHKEGSLRDRLSDLSQDNDFRFSSHLKPWYVREAIEDFFGKKPYKSYENELQIKTPTEVELLWRFQTKDNMATLIGELYDRTGISGVGMPIYDFGHRNRGFETFPEIITLSDLKNPRFYDTVLETQGLEAEIDTSSLFKQLGKIMEDYLESDPENLNPEWYEKKLELHQRASEELKGVEVTLQMESNTVKIQNLPSPESKYELVAYSIHLPKP